MILGCVWTARFLWLTLTQRRFSLRANIPSNWSFSAVVPALGNPPISGTISSRSGMSESIKTSSKRSVSFQCYHPQIRL